MVNVSDFETTADGSMVRVDMTNPALRANEPVGKFVDVNQAIMMEAQGLCVMRRKNEENLMIHNSSRVMVEYLEQVLVNSYGKYGIYNRKDAELGEKIGKWRITGPEPGQIPSQGKVLLNERRESKTKGIRKQKVAWIQDNFIVGGAELSSRLVIEVGIDCGYSIDLITPPMDLLIIETILSKSDFIVINNFWGFSGEQVRIVLKAIYSDGKPYIKYEHDHREFDRLEFSRRLFQGSRLNVFLSPIHLKNHQEVLGCEGIAFPLAIDVDLFKPVEGVKRKERTAVVCNMRNFKKWGNLQKYIDDHQEIQFTIMAKDTQVQGSNVTVREMIPYEKMPELYSEFEYLVHILDGWGAGERVVLEAALCGCKIVANERVGHMSWNKDLANTNELREWLRIAPYQFWKEVEGRVLC
ncbi:MAG: hypothetical protein MUP27_09395 [Desulfobacterales bacterium]|nr:hypothetical protein [Desulfobacterales bacterium]